MVDFIASLKKGIDSAAIADLNNKEIKEVFSELNRQLSLDYGDRLKIERQEAFALNDNIMEMKKTWWVVASSSQTGRNERLAEWSQGRLGYPCSIKFGGTKYVCENKRALENNLANLLADPIVARNIMQLIEP